MTGESQLEQETPSFHVSGYSEYQALQAALPVLLARLRIITALFRSVQSALLAISHLSPAPPDHRDQLLADIPAQLPRIERSRMLEM